MKANTNPQPFLARIGKHYLSADSFINLKAAANRITKNSTFPEDMMFVYRANGVDLPGALTIKRYNTIENGQVVRRGVWC